MQLRSLSRPLSMLHMMATTLGTGIFLWRCVAQGQGESLAHAERHIVLPSIVLMFCQVSKGGKPCRRQGLEACSIGHVTQDAAISIQIDGQPCISGDLVTPPGVLSNLVFLDPASAALTARPGPEPVISLDAQSLAGAKLGFGSAPALQCYAAHVNQARIYLHVQPMQAQAQSNIGLASADVR